MSENVYESNKEENNGYHELRDFNDKSKYDTLNEEKCCFKRHCNAFDCDVIFDTLHIIYLLLSKISTQNVHI